MSDQASKPAHGPSRLWGLILFIPAGVGMIIASFDVGSRDNPGPTVVLLAFGVFTVVAGAAFFLRLPWAEKLVTVLVLLGLLILLLQRYSHVF